MAAILALGELWRFPAGLAHWPGFFLQPQIYPDSTGRQDQSLGNLRAWGSFLVRPRIHLYDTGSKGVWTTVIAITGLHKSGGLTCPVIALGCGAVENSSYFPFRYDIFTK